MFTCNIYNDSFDKLLIVYVVSNYFLWLQPLFDYALFLLGDP